MSGEYSRETLSFDGPGSSPIAPNGTDANSPSPAVTSSTPQPTDTGSAAPPSGPSKAVENVLTSDIGITTLLTRLKQSIASARDFAAFLKKRSSLEEEQANGLKRLAKTQLDGVRRSEVRGGSYAQQLAEVFRVHERMAENGMQFALSLHQMHEDLTELSNNMERGRKQWKHEGLDAEKKASDAEQAMQKAKARYDSLAEDYDRARTGDSRGSRRIGLKGPKSAEQHEQDLLRKTQTADTDYEEKVRQAKSQREFLLNKGRPEAVRALQDLINECDSALALQLQKFAAFNEKLLLGNGLIVSPLSDRENATMQRSLRDTILDIDNERDFNGYIASHSGKVTRPSDIVYEKHPTLAPKQQQPRQPSGPASSAGQYSAAPPTLTVNTGPSQPNSMNSRYGPPIQVPPPQQQQQQQQQQPPSYAQPPPNTFQSPLSLDPQPPSFNPQPQFASSQQQTPARDAYNNTPPYPTHSDRTPQQTTGIIPPSMQAGSPIVSRPQQASTRPVFGVSLEELYARDQSAVPMIVFQCMQAVDLFGLDVEGIYRLSGTSTHVNALRSAFDSLPPSALQLDFRNPANFFHDVNSVATLLKAFFRDLPDPLFTRAAYDSFIQAAKHDADDARRDALHQLINDLPDPNYATLRALVLHLGRIMQNESRTRMGSSNLAVCFAPSLMGTHTGAQIADASLQARVLDSILTHATAIFDED